MPACGADGGAAERCAPLAFAPCAPLYAPTFTDIYSRRLSTTCSSGGGACHGASEGRGGRGGLTLDDADSAYQGLVDEGRVTPGDADCGDLVERLTTSDPGTLMPPGSPLPDSESCAIRQWISDGAKR